MPNCFPCPKCNRLLLTTGSVSLDGVEFPVFQCDDCTAMVQMFGKPFEIALTFALDEEGKPFDPATPDGSLPF